MAKGLRKQTSPSAESPATSPDVVSASPSRRRLDDTRTGLTHKFNVCGHEGYLIVGLFDDGRPGEVFLKMAKEGSTVRGLMDSIGVLTSLALQYGVPLDALAAKFAGARFEPLGWTQNSKIRETTSIVDYIFRWLALMFAEDSPAPVETPQTETPTEIDAANEAAGQPCNEPASQDPPRRTTKSSRKRTPSTKKRPRR